MYFDFLHVDKPIIFFVYDLEDCKRDRGLYFDFKKTMPGPKACTLRDLIEKIEAIILKREDTYKIKRRKIRELMFDKEAGSACERLYNLISQII
ncbi:MAG: CDP-glycerol glycerophosphotransferase family protein [Candidatus Njordarchaeum guaymaensis]